MNEINKLESVIDSVEPKTEIEKMFIKSARVNLADAKKTGSQSNKRTCLNEVRFYLRELGVECPN